MYPQGFKFSKEHEWIKVEGDVGTVGITEFAQEQLGDVVDVMLPAVGESFDKDDKFGEIDSVKASSDLFSPVGGEVTEINEALADAPESVNEDPHGAAWMIKIRLADRKQLDELMDAGRYEEFVKSEG